MECTSGRCTKNRICPVRTSRTGLPGLKPMLTEVLRSVAVLAGNPKTWLVRFIFASVDGLFHCVSSCVRPQGYVHAVMGSKTFQVYHAGKFQAYAARPTVRGAYIILFSHQDTSSRLPLSSKTLGPKLCMRPAPLAMARCSRSLEWPSAAARMYAKPLHRCLAVCLTPTRKLHD